jgi:hypothetical protein
MLLPDANLLLGFAAVGLLSCPFAGNPRFSLEAF